MRPVGASVAEYDAAVRAAQIAELGGPPEVVDLEGDGPVEILAVALNPLDLAVAAGRFYGGHPPLPYVPGCEAVGRRDGQRVYLFGEGRGTQSDGFVLGRTDFPSASAVPVPDELDDAQAVACGIAGVAGWVPVARRAPVQPDDRVLVLGATGTVGSVAVQAARVLGAARVVAVGRDESRLRRALELGADDTVPLVADDQAAQIRSALRRQAGIPFSERDLADLVTRLKEASGGDGPTLVVDALWGEFASAAVEAAAPKARIVHLGQSAGSEATFTSAAVRGKQLSILGHSNFALPPDERRQAYADVSGHVAAGRITIDVETFALDDIASAWVAQASGRKAVVRL